MTRYIDFKLLSISAAILSVAVALAWAAIELFRQLFPVLSENTFWDELTGPTIAALVLVAVKMLLYRKRTFHLEIISDRKATRTQVLILRRETGLRLIYMPRFWKEAQLSGGRQLVRNIFWWGVWGVDRCLLCIRTGDQDPCRMVELPVGSAEDFATVQLALKQLKANRTYRVTLGNVNSGTRPLGTRRRAE